MLAVFLFPLFAFSFQDSSSIEEHLRAMEAPTARERHRAELHLAEILRVEHAPAIRDAVRSGGPELSARLASLLSARPEFFPVLGRWLVSEGIESSLAKDALRGLWMDFRGKERESDPKKGPEQPLDSFQHVWVRLPKQPYALLRLLDNYHRFGVLKKPLLLDPEGPFEDWALADGNHEGYAGPLLLDSIQRLAGPELRGKEALRDFSSFLWISLDFAEISEEEIFLRLVRAWNSERASARRLAALALGSLGFGPAEKQFADELIRKGPGWKECLAGLTTGQGVSPWLRSREAATALLDLLLQSQGFEREIAYALVALGRQDAEGRSREPLLLEFHKKAEGPDRLIVEFVLARLSFRSGSDRLRQRLQEDPSEAPGREEEILLALSVLSDESDSAVVDALWRGLDRGRSRSRWAALAAKIVKGDEPRRRLCDRVADWAFAAAESRIESQMESAAESIFRLRQAVPADWARRSFFSRYEKAKSEESKTWMAAVAALGGASFEPAILINLRERLFLEISNPESRCPEIAARALGKVGDAALRDRLCELVLDSARHRAVRERALFALRYAIPALPSRERGMELARIQNCLSSARAEEREFAERFSFWSQEFRNPPLEGENLLDRDELGFYGF